MTCHLKSSCNTTCPSLKKVCPIFRQDYFSTLVSSLPLPHPDRSRVISTPPVTKPSCYYSTSTQQLQAMLLSTVQMHISQVKIYRYNTAIQASFEDTLPSESIIYIDSVTSYQDTTKGLRAIESFIDALIEAKKIVFLHVKSDYTNPNYTRC